MAYASTRGYALTPSSYAFQAYAEKQGYASFANNYNQPPFQSYTQNSSYYKRNTQRPYLIREHSHDFAASDFLATSRPETPIISRIGEVKPVVEEAFEKLTGQKFPHDDIKIVILNNADFHDLHKRETGSTSQGVMGFSYNKYGRGTSEIYIKEDNLDALLLTIGHEIGHVLSPTLFNAQDEEAKAHAFSLAWMETIRDNNIAGLEPNISLNPAKNGLHDVAWNFVQHLLKTGASAYDIFKTLSRGLASIIASEENHYG